MEDDRLSQYQSSLSIKHKVRMNKVTTEYIPQPVNTKDVVLPAELNALVEVIAKNVHEVWAQSRLEQGWTYGSERNDKQKKHPGLLPYEQLSETEKEYDRNTAMETLRLIQKMGFTINKSDVE